MSEFPGVDEVKRLVIILHHLFNNLLLSDKLLYKMMLFTVESASNSDTVCVWAECLDMSATPFTL